MKQSRLMSIIEQGASTVIGLVVALVTQLAVFPLFGFHPPLVDNLAITGIFTVVSIVRGFLVRRAFEALHIRRPLSPFIAAVVAERFRQVEAEGWSAEHDEDHKPGELARAGAAYAIYARWHITENKSSGIFQLASQVWPWGIDWWKPAGFRRDLVKAAALILAEGEKFDRAKKVRA